MRKISFILFATLMVVSILSSCSKDEDEIIGKWAFTAVNADVETSDDEVTESLRKEYLQDGNSGVMEFKKGGKAISTDGKEMSYSVNGDKLTINYDKKTEIYTYSINGTMLIMSQDLLDKKDWSKYTEAGVTIKKFILRMELLKK